MGKIKGRRQRGNRYNPMGVESAPSNGVEDHPSGVTIKAGLRNLGEKFSSHLVEERVTGLNTLAALALEPSNPDQIVEAGIVTKIAPLLKDESVLVRLAAAGALRNISAGGSDKVVESMVQEDVMVHLSSLLREYREPWTPDNAQNDAAIDTAREDNTDPKTSVFIHSTYLLLNLCECSEEAINVLNQEGLVQIMLSHFDSSIWGLQVSLAAAECLLCASENNESAASTLLPSADSMVSVISRPTTLPSDLHFAITLAGILYNIGYCSSGGNNFQLIVQVVSVALESDVLALTTEYNSAITSQATPTMVAADIEHLIMAQQLALEILSNICCADDEEELEDDGDCDDMEEEAGESMEVGCNGNRDIPTADLPPEVVEGLVHFKLIDKVLTKVHFPDDELCSTLATVKRGKSLLSKLGVLRVRALLSLQNIVSCLEMKDMGGPDRMYSTWTNLGNLVFKKPCTDIPLLEASTGAMRAIMDSLSKSSCDQLAGLSHTDLQLIFEAGVTCSVASVRANLARMVGTLGCLLVTQNSQDMITEDPAHTVITAATEYLLKVAANDEELWVSAEALDVLIDLYSDDKTDQLAQTTHLVDRFKTIGPQFKGKYQQQKKKLGEHRALVLTVRDNLVSFTKYKGGRVKNLANKKSKKK